MWAARTVADAALGGIDGGGGVRGVRGSGCCVVDRKVLEGCVMASNFFSRNAAYCVTNPRKAWATRAAMEAHRKAHPLCELTGKIGVHVHHIESIWAAPERAADPTNFISLCPKAHLMWGHAGHWKRYVENVAELVQQAKIVRQQKPQHNP